MKAALMRILWDFCEFDEQEITQQLL